MSPRLTSLRTRPSAAVPPEEIDAGNFAWQRSQIAVGGVPVIHANDSTTWMNRYALPFRQVPYPKCSGVGEPVDEENPPDPTTSSPDTPSQQDLIKLSQDFIEEEHREINGELKAQFIAIQKDMLERKDFSRMPDAQKLLIQMHDRKQADLDRGFERGGEIYSYRNIVGSILSFAPLLLTYLRTQPEFKKDQSFQLKMAAGYFGSVLLTSCAAAAINARVLLHCTPMQDAVFDGSPYVAPELDSKNTPSYVDIKKELDAAVKMMNDLETAFVELQALQGKEHVDKLKSVHGLMAQIDQNKGIQHYTGRALLQRAYMEGLQRQSILQTGKVYGNLAAGWASFLKNDPILGMKIQFFVGMAQIIGQRLVAPADQKQLQNNLFKVEISSRPLSGEDHYGDDQIIRGMLRTPREVRVLNLQMLVTSYVDTQAQLIADALGIDATDYKKYRRLRRLESDFNEFAQVKTLIDRIRGGLGDEIIYGEFGQSSNGKSRFSAQGAFSELITEVHTAIASQFELRSIEKLIELERKVAGNTLNENELGELAEHKRKLGSVLTSMPTPQRERFFATRSLLIASTFAARRRSSHNLAFDSEILSASFNTLSTRHSDEEILAELIVELAESPEIFSASIHESDGEIDWPIDPRNSQVGDIFPWMSAHLPVPSQWANMAEIFESELGISTQEFNQVIAFTSGSGNALPAPQSQERRALQKIKNKLDGAITKLNSERVFEIWGISGLEKELAGATRSKNYCREDDLIRKLAEKLTIPYQQYRKYHELKMHYDGINLCAFHAREAGSLRQLQQVIDRFLPDESGKKSCAVAKLQILEKKYSEIENDPRHIIERRFDRVSDHHQKLIIDGMQVTRNEGFFTLKTETGMLLKEGLRRGGDAPEYMATYAAGMWRAFQLGVTGVNGPLMLSAAVGLCEQIYKSTLKDPHAFKSPAWPKALTTAITFMALAANIMAAHRVAEANVAPLSWPLKLQKLFGGTGSIAETILQVGKLVVREMFRQAKRSSNDPEPLYGEIGVRRIASRYYFATIQAGARISDGLAILINGGIQAKAARKSYEALAAKKNDKVFNDMKKERETLTPSTQT